MLSLSIADDQKIVDGIKKMSSAKISLLCEKYYDKTLNIANNPINDKKIKISV